MTLIISPSLSITILQPYLRHCDPPAGGVAILIYNLPMVSKQYYVYILTNFSKTVLYTGVTNNLKRRVWEHRQDLLKGFTQKYQVHSLVYYEVASDPESAILREKQIKNYSRKRKEEIILKFNPKVEDLYRDIIE